MIHEIQLNRDQINLRKLNSLSTFANEQLHFVAERFNLVDFHLNIEFLLAQLEDSGRLCMWSPMMPGSTGRRT